MGHRGAALIACAVSPSKALAGKPRCRLERVDLSKFTDGGQIKAVAGVVELEGQVNTERPASAFRLLVNGKPVAKPDKAEPFERAGQELYLVLAVEISALFAPSFEKIKETLREFWNRCRRKPKSNWCSLATKSSRRRCSWHRVRWRRSSTT